MKRKFQVSKLQAMAALESNENEADFNRTPGKLAKMKVPRKAIERSA